MMTGVRHYSQMCCKNFSQRVTGRASNITCPGLGLISLAWLLNLHIHLRSTRIKLVIGDDANLLPHPFGLVQAATELVKLGFDIFRYCAETE
jgi:hypothetical protein